MAIKDSYSAEDWGDEELVKKFKIQKDDALTYFKTCIKPRLDRSYKLYISYTGDRALEIKKWQANVFVPYIHAVVETLKPRILDARPDLTVQGRTEEDQLKSDKVQQLLDYNWEIANADKVAEMLVSACLIYGLGFMQAFWKKDKRTYEFLKSHDINKKKLTWVKEEKTFYDAPCVTWVDNYALMYDWHNITRESKQFWLKRTILTAEDIKRQYPSYDKNRLELALKSGSGDLTDYGSIRNEVRAAHEGTVKGDSYRSTGPLTDIYNTNQDQDLKMNEVFEWTRPFDDRYAVMVNDIPILKGGSIPTVYNFKETTFIDVPYLRLPNEFEGYGIPMILESPQILLNTIKNQRIDNVTLGIHKMWIVNPLANINKSDLVARPYGIIYSTDPAGVREVESTDISTSSYKEEDMLKGDMRYASGVDDFSMGVGGGTPSATEVRHLRESTLERVRLFINHLGEGFSVLMRYWFSMYQQFFTKSMTIRILGDKGQIDFPLIEKDDLMGNFDFKATVIPSIAGMNDVKKKQDMDLFQLLSPMPFIDPEKLTSKMLYDWNWNLESIKANTQEGMLPPGMEGLPQEGMAGVPGEVPVESGLIPPTKEGFTPEIKQAIFDMLGKVYQPEGQFNPESAFGQAANPINLLQAGTPPTVKGVPQPTTNLRGLNRTGRVNTNISMKGPSNPEALLQNRVANIQR